MRKAIAFVLACLFVACDEPAETHLHAEEAIEVVAVCGDKITQTGELCDGDLPSSRCQDYLAFTRGVAKCDPSCLTIDLSGCVLEQSLQGSRGPAGASCWDVDDDGVADPDEDTNGDGVFSSLDCINTNGTPPVDEGAHTFVFNQENYGLERTWVDGARVVFEGDIELATTLSIPRTRGALEIVGSGTISGASIDLGQHTVVRGVTFKDTTLTGLNVTFIDCRFVGEITLDFDRARMAQVKIQQVRLDTKLTELDITFSELRDVTQVDGKPVWMLSRSEVDDSVLDVQRLQGSSVDGTRLTITEFAGNNDTEDTVLVVDIAHHVHIADNNFDGLYSDAAESIHVIGSSAGVVHIHDNTFDHQDNFPRAIRVEAIDTGRLSQLVKITDNVFSRAPGVVVWPTDNSIPVVASNNVLLDTTFLGIQQRLEYSRYVDGTIDLN